MGKAIWRIAVMGAGALGCFYGARLLQAGHEVAFIARGDNLRALQSKGLRLIRDEGESYLAPVSASEDPASIGTVDLVLLTTKGQHLADAVPAMAPVVGDQTAVLPLLNGIDIAERVADGLGRGVVLGGMTRCAARLLEPGVVSQRGEERDLVLGQLQLDHETVAQSTASVLQKAGVNAVYSASVRTDLWLKFLGWTACAAGQCTSRLQVAEMLTRPDTSDLFDAVVREGEALASRLDVALPEGLLERLREVMMTYPRGTNVSIFDDLQAGRPLELDTTLGATVALGERVGVPTPRTREVYETLRPFVGGSA